MIRKVSSTYTRRAKTAPKTTKGKVKKAIRGVKNREFKNKVLRVIHEIAETKQGFHSVTAENFNSGIDASTDCKRLMPNISKSTDDNGRIGDQVTARSLVVKGAVVYNPSTTQYGTYANARLGVRLMVVQPRVWSNIDQVQSNAATWTQYLLKKGGTTTGFSGVLSDLWAPVNTDGIIKYYDRVFYMDGPYQLSGVGSIQLLNSTKFFNIRMKLRNKVIKYDSSVSSGIQPSNYSPVLVVGYAHMDGSAVDVATTAIQMSYDAIFDYEDS